MKKKSQNFHTSCFIQKTFDMLSNLEIVSIVSWSDSGSEFIIHSLPDFSEVILPKYFKHSNFPSFIRQLNMYDFHKIRSSEHGWMYSHPFFIQDRPDLLKKIMRKTREKSEIIENQGKIKEFPATFGKIFKINKKQQKIELKLNILNEKIEDLQQSSSKIIEELKESNTGFSRILNVFEMFRRNNESRSFKDQLSELSDKLNSAEVSTESIPNDENSSSLEDLFFEDYP